MRKIGLLCGFLAVFSGASLAHAEDKKADPALWARATWSAFECSVIAYLSRDTDEQKRLWAYGYERGQRFMSELKDGKLDKSQLGENMPEKFLSILQGPSTDFVVGRIYQMVETEVMGGPTVRAKDGSVYVDEQLYDIAAQKFRSLNCALIGQ